MQNENKLNTFSINQSKLKIIAKQAQGDCEGADFVFVSAATYKGSTTCKRKFTIGIKGYIQHCSNHACEGAKSVA